MDTIRSGGPVDEVLSRFRNEGMSREEAAVWSGRRRRSAAWMSCSAVVTGGGFIDRFAGDAIIVAFNAVTDQSDHPMRAARAGLAIRSGAESLAADHADWPRFRIAVNTGGWSRSPAETE